MKKNRKIQIWFVALATMLFTASCEKDEIIVETFENNNPKVKEITFKELSSDVKFVNAFSKISKNHQINNSLGRTVMENQYNFTIDDYPAKVIELDSLTSYTFSINNQTRTNSVFENLVINHYTNGITKAAIIKYTPNQNNILNDSIVNEHNSKHFEGTTEIIPIIYNANNINQRQTTICFTSNVLLCNYGGREHPAGERCETTYWGTQTTCETIFTAPDYYTSIVQIIEDTGNNNGGATSVSVGMALADNFANTQLTPEQKLIYDSNPSIREYLANNIEIVDIPNYNPLIGGDSTMAIIKPEAEQFVIELTNFISQNPSFNSHIMNYLDEENWSDESVEFIEYALDVLNENPNANPLLGADCSSFEFAQPPGATKKGCAVTNFNHTFYTAGVFPNGSPYYGEIDSTVPIAYFTMPSYMTNGRAANLTAKAVTFAIKATDLYYAANPTVSAYALGQYFKNRLTHFLGAVGGSISTTTPPFTIPSPAPYITSILGISNPYNCE